MVSGLPPLGELPPRRFWARIRAAGHVPVGNGEYPRCDPVPKNAAALRLLDMFIYCLEIHLSLPSHSLKEKRGIVKSILGRAKSRFNVGCAEVDRQDNATVAVLAFVTVSSDKLLPRQVLERVEEWIYEGWPDVEITGSDISEI